MTIASYIGFTLGVTEWRMVFRRSMNELDLQANSKAIDALLNYETVKYFGNERYEVARYDGNLASWDALCGAQPDLAEFSGTPARGDHRRGRHRLSAWPPVAWWMAA